MPADRPAIPAALRRSVYVEAGHRCAIPTCRQAAGLEIHHITPWSVNPSHEPENLIVLCAVCHARVTRGEIDSRAVRAYKANLGVINGRYGDLERRVLEMFVQQPERDTVELDKAHELLLKYLVDDGCLEYVSPAKGAIAHRPVDAPANWQPASYLGPATWRLTAVGQALVEGLRSATQIG